MNKKFKHIESRGLPGGPNEQFTYITGVFSIDGYKSDSPDVNNPFNIIPSADITMEGVDFPVRGYGNNGIVQDMKPGKKHYNYGNADYVVEVPMAQKGMFDFDFSGVKKNIRSIGDYMRGKQGFVPDILTDNKPTKKQLRTAASYLSPKNWEHFGKALPNYNEYNSLDDAFNAARTELGKQQFFLYDGKRHSTNYRGETADPETKEILGRLKEGLTPEQYKIFEDVWIQSHQPNLSTKRDTKDFYVPFSAAGVGFDDLPNTSKGRRPHVNVLDQDETVYQRKYNNPKQQALKFLDEFVHSIQLKDKGTAGMLKDLILDSFMHGSHGAYSTEGTMEYEAHKKMYPELRDYFLGTGEKPDFLNKSKAQKGMNVEGQKQKKWFDSYIRSDKYLERLGKEFPDMSADELANERWARLMNMRSTPIGFLPESSDISPTSDSTQGVYDPEEKKIILRPEYSEGRQGPWSYNTIPLHEMGHAVDEGGKRIPQTTLDFLMPKLKQNPYDIPKETFYYTDPTEYINRLQPLRYLLQEEGIYDAKKKDFTKEDLQKAKENTRIKYNRHFKDLMENTESEEDLIEIMNNIASIDNSVTEFPIAQTGIEVPFRNIIFTPLFKFLKETKKDSKEEEYYNPKVEKNITSGNPGLDALYENQWLMDVPFIGDYIKDKAKKIASISSAPTRLDNQLTKEHIDYAKQQGRNYDGSADNGVQKIKLLEQYFSEEPLLPVSSYKPISDYLEFLPSYSIKGILDEHKNNTMIRDERDTAIKRAFVDILKGRKSGVDSAELYKDSKVTEAYAQFLKDKKPIFLTHDYLSPLQKLLGVNLGGHKTGMAWDEEVGLPYISISDAWDFSPDHYSKKWEGRQDGLSNEGLRQRSKIQAALMHKAGNPFKIYDRFYFEPQEESIKYYTDKEIQQLRNSKKETKKQLGGSIAKKYAQEGEETSRWTISAYEEPAWYEKALDYLASPMTAFGFFTRNQSIPDNLPINIEDRNIYDSIIDTVNPFAWIKYGASAKRNYDQGEYLDAGFDALGAIPIVPAWLSKGKKPVKSLKNFKSEIDWAKWNKEIPQNKVIEPIYRGVYINDEIRNLPKFKGKTDDEILDIMGTRIPGNTGTRRKKQLQQTLNFGRDYESALKHIGKFTDKNSFSTIGNTSDLTSGKMYILKVKPDDLPFISPEQQNILYDQTIDAWRKNNPNAGFILGDDAKNLNPELLRQFGKSPVFRSEGVNVIDGNFPQFIGIEDTKIGKLLEAKEISRQDYLDYLSEFQEGGQADFYKKYGGDISGLDKAQLGAFLKRLKPAIKKGVNYVDEFIKNDLYKYNPWAYNNIDSKLPEWLQLSGENEKWLRQVGKSGIEDAQATRTVRELGEEISPRLFAEKLAELQNLKMGQWQLSKRYPGPFFKKGETFFDYNKKSKPGLEGKLNTRGRSGSADYLIEFNPSDPIKYQGMDSYFQPAYMQNMMLDPAPFDKLIGDVAIMKPKMRGVENFNFYKKDPFWAYKKVPLDELQEGGQAPFDKESWEYYRQQNPEAVMNPSVNDSVVMQPKDSFTKQEFIKNFAKPKPEFQKPKTLNFNNILDYVVETRGGNRDLWGKAADTIAFHESGPWARMDVGAKQHLGGPGRGLFQFEGPSLKTAQKRYINIAKSRGFTPNPDILNAKSADQLNAQDQYTLFFANLIESKAKLSDYAKGKMKLEDLWLTGHKNVEKQGDRESFLESLKAAEKEGIKNGYTTFKRGGEFTLYDIYKKYVMGGATDEVSKDIYDKLNRVHYKDAKGVGMSVPNYILTYVMKSS